MTSVTEATLRNMKRAEKGTLPTYSRLVDLAKSNGDKDTDDISWATESDLMAVGFSRDEAAAVMFIMTQDCMGVPATSAEQVSRFLNFCI